MQEHYIVPGLLHALSFYLLKTMPLERPMKGKKVMHKSVI